jgi:hypothetical protein
MNAFAETVKHAAEVVGETKSHADDGEKSVSTAVQQMKLIEQTVSESGKVIEDLGHESDKIGAIVDAISQIAEQTNLLALNAAIEAARAGEHGRGFAVVADEVRKLAEQSSQSAGEIAALITSIQNKSKQAVTVMEEGVRQVQSGTAAVDGAGATFHSIAGMVDKVANDSVLIQFPPKGGVNPIIGELEGGKAKVDASAAEPLNNVLDIARKFVMGAIKHCTKSIEFIPLFDFTGDIRNYSFEEMKTDIIEAVKNKRNLCIIDKFQAYLDNQKDQKYEFNQYLIDFNSNPSEYSDFVLMVQNNNLSELRKIYKTKLKRTSWF